MAAVLGALVVQLLLVGQAFPISQVFTDQPLLLIDHPFHLYQIKVALALAEHGRLTGYDPFFGAGYVGGVTFNASAKAPALLAWALRGVLGEVQVYKLFVATVAVLAPAAVALAAVLVRATWPQVGLSAALALGLWWASAFHWYHTAGLVSFVFASFAALPFCALLNRLFEAPRTHVVTLLLLGAAGAALFLVHPFFAVPVVFFGLARLVIERPRVPPLRLAGRLALVGMLCVLPNLPWLLAMTGQASIGPSRYSINYQMLVDHRLVWKELLGLWAEPAKGAKVYPLLALLAFWSLRGERPQRAFCIASILTWAALVLFAAFGAALPFIGPVQPNRFSATAYLFLVAPAGFGAASLIDTMRGRANLRRHAAWACAVIGVALGLLVANEVRREASDGPAGRYGSAPPEVRGVGPKGTALLAWLAAETRPEGRVLFETSLARVHDGGHIAGYLQMQSGREFIGGPYNNFFAGTRDGWMFGRPLNDIPPATFLDYLRLYNIGWIAVHSAVAKRYLAQFDGHVTPRQAFDGLQTYSVEQPLDFVAEGQAVVRSRAIGRLVVERRGPPGQSVVLKYHLVPGLHALDGSTVEPAYLLDDPDPFIRVTPRGEVVELVR